MLMPALTIRPVPAQRRLPIISCRSPTIVSISASVDTVVRRRVAGADAGTWRAGSGVIVRIT